MVSKATLAGKGKQRPPEHRDTPQGASSGRGLAKMKPGDEQTPWALMGAGIELAGSVCLLTLLGWWLDSKWHTTPWLLLTGACIGIVGGMYKFWKVGTRSFKR